MTDDVRPYLEIRTASPSGFSPDGSRLLVSSNLPGTAQLYRLSSDQLVEAPLAPSELDQLTSLPEPVGGAYLPTDDRLLLATDAGGNERHQLYTLGADPAAPVRSVDELEPLVVDAEHIHRPGGLSRDGRLLAYATNRRNGTDFDVVVRDLTSGEEETVYAPGGWAGAAGFSPDAAVVAISELTERPGDNRVHLLERATGQLTELDRHPDAPASVGSPGWYPGSRRFVYSSDVGREFSAVFRGSLDGVEPELVFDPGWDAGAAIDWHGRQLLVVWNEDGISRARLLDPETFETRVDVPLPGDGVASGWRFSRDGRYLAFGFSSSLVPGDAWRYDVDRGELLRLTSSPSDVDPAGFAEPDLVRFPSFDGESVPAFVFRPRGPARTGRLPVVVVLHGGPESQYRPSFAPLTQYLLARGFAVVAPNVRGSTGYGKRYEHLDDVEKRLDAVADLAALHDWIASTDDLDPDRCALYGGSYGGYLVLAGLAFQPERWAAGVDIVGISSLVTFLENTSPWRRKFREREYGSLEHDRELLVEASPITHIGRVRAPLFVIHGANDPRVPLSEAEQVSAVLRANGVRCELAVYEDEGHGLAKLANRIDAYPRVAAFLDEVLVP
jgi:dipeptidyl aminopeptidase/acylaminoacyl peptidase